MRELGPRLVRAREARGLTLEDAERDTRISRRYLQALESEQFEAIPAPVYARGFLRSYSQYLGLDAQEMLSLFPRDRDDSEPVQAPARASVREPLSAVGPARPAWRKPEPPQPRTADGRARARQPEPEPEWEQEPVIGIHIGTPAPARRIQTDPAAQARTTVVIVVAVAAIIFVSLLAFAISRFGGGDGDPGASSENTPAGGATVGGGGSNTIGSSAGGTAAASPSAQMPGVVRGKVPDVAGEAVSTAKAMIEAAGFQAKELPAPHSEPKNTVYDQSPAPGGDLPEGSIVTIAVSTGPQ